jgi:CRISPR/Cas system CSM-associated protein Csm3 (group 7 of RAMP superfamily)
LKFELSSYWRIGSGKGAGVLADSIILRDVDGLPTIPGRSIKGLLRDAMELATLSGTVAGDRIERWFGTPLPSASDGENQGDRQELALEESRFLTQEGALWFGSARLSNDWIQWAKTAPEERKASIVDTLTCYQSSTAIDKVGVAKEHSLRVSEVAVPMTLWAEVRGPEDDNGWVEDLKNTLPLLRALGSRRSRGLGRVDVTLEVGK